MSWKDLDIKQRAELIKLGIQSGLRDIKQIRELYDSDNIDIPINSNNSIIRNQEEQVNNTSQDDLFIENLVQEANAINNIPQYRVNPNIDTPPFNISSTGEYQQQFKNGGFKDNPPFIQRILNKDYRSVTDWQDNTKQSTHKLSYAQTPEGYIVYPEVQIVEEKIHDFTDPQYKHGKWDALDNAIRNNDTLRFSTEKEALKYAQEYKNKYPEYFKQFDNGVYTFPKGVFQYNNGGSINSPEEPEEIIPRANLVGTVSWNPFNVFNRNYRGTNIYESENFGDSFRQARMDGVDKFVWNGNVYNTNLKPNKLVEAAREWNVENDLNRRNFQRLIIQNPDQVMNAYRKLYDKKRYPTYNKKWDNEEYDIEKMYLMGVPKNIGMVIDKNTKYDIGDQIWEALNTTDLTYNQKMAILANSYKESGGWRYTKQINGPARGYFQMEDIRLKQYKNWLNENKLKDNAYNQALYVAQLFINKDSSLITPQDGMKYDDRLKDIDSQEKALQRNQTSIASHWGYTNDQAWEDWDSNNLDDVVRSVEALFEKAGVPDIETRNTMAYLLTERYK